MKPTLAMLKRWEANKNPMAKPSGRDQKVGFDVKGQCIIKNNMGVSENGGFPPQIIHFNRDFHYFHHPFLGVFPLFLGNTQSVGTKVN